MISPYPVFIVFFIYSFGLGTLFPRIGDIQITISLGEGALWASSYWLAFWPAKFANNS